MSKSNYRYLIGPFSDLMVLGGGSLLLLPFLFYSPNPEQVAFLIATAFIVADFVNHPHFAASYIMFYRTFRQKVSDVQYNKFFRIRYVFAGVMVPLILAGYFVLALQLSSLTLLGYAGNTMFFLVGWHYIKQGYGIMIVDSVLKKQFYLQKEKVIFLVNGFVFWLLTWTTVNHIFSGGELWGISYYAIPVPLEVIYTLGMIALVTGILVVSVIIRRLLRQPTETAWVGVISYIVSVYIWLVGLNLPVFLIFIPAFHSLQYLAVVYRFEKNRIAKNIDDKSQRRQALVRFAGLSVILGFLSFWFIPGMFEGVMIRSELILPAMYVFSFWVFINIHHYFIDNVLWRSQNHEVKENLFS